MTDFTEDQAFEAALSAYEYASGDDLPPSHHGLRAAVRRALEVQREEIAQAIEAAANADVVPPARKVALACAEVAREYGKD